MRLSIGKKITACFLLFMLLYGCVFFFYTVPQYKAALYREKEVALKEKVDSVVTILMHYYGQEVDGKLTREQAQAQAKQVIGAMRYDGSNYFWIDTTEVINVLLPPQPETEGNSRARVQDSHGKYMVKEFVEGAIKHKEEGFYLDYWFPKMGEDKPSPKSAYVKLFDPWGWVIGTGIYVDDVEKVIAADRRAQIIMNLVIMVLAFLILTVYTQKFISKPLAQMSADAKLMAEGKFTYVLSIQSNDEIGDLAESLNQMAGGLKGLIERIITVAQNLAAQSQQLAASCEEVSATTEEVASTTNEVAAMTEQGVENVIVTAQQSEQVLATAEAGNQSVARTVDMMNTIAQGSQSTEAAVKQLGELSLQIGNISDVITGIAEQTNLLALNAAIEAARAGDHGRGFSVVAEEVRKLAEQSASAAKEIGQLISQIQRDVSSSVQRMADNSQQVLQGVDLASHAGQALADIVQANDQNLGLIQEIVEAIQQASQGTQQLTAANEQITSSVQQIAAAAQELASLSVELQGSVEKFEI